MRYKILNSGEVINIIIADEAFCRAYCAENGFTYELDDTPIPDPDPVPEPEEEPSVWDELDAAYTAGYQEGVDSV